MNEQENIFMAFMHCDINVEDWYNNCIGGLEHWGCESFSNTMMEKLITEVGKNKGKEVVEIKGHQLFDKMAESKSKTFTKKEECWSRQTPTTKYRGC